MSVSTKNGSCSKCACEASSRNRGGRSSAPATGGGQVNCPGFSGGSGGVGGDIAGDFACPNMSDECRDNLAGQINERLCAQLGGGFFSDICYECGELLATIRGECNSCGEFTGTISIDPTQVSRSCEVIDCS
jgi:hypothetical protein